MVAQQPESGGPSRQMDGQTDRRTDRQLGSPLYTACTSRCSSDLSQLRGQAKAKAGGQTGTQTSTTQRSGAPSPSLPSQPGICFRFLNEQLLACPTAGNGSPCQARARAADGATAGRAHRVGRAWQRLVSQQRLPGCTEFGFFFLLLGMGGNPGPCGSRTALRTASHDDAGPGPGAPTRPLLAEGAD
jgi:hypothetical protein